MRNLSTSRVLALLISQWFGCVALAALPSWTGHWSGTVTVENLGDKTIPPHHRPTHEIVLNIRVDRDGTVEAALDGSADPGTGLYYEDVPLANQVVGGTPTPFTLTGACTISPDVVGVDGGCRVSHTLNLIQNPDDANQVSGTYEQKLYLWDSNPLHAMGSVSLRRVSRVPGSLTQACNNQSPPPGNTPTSNLSEFVSGQLVWSAPSTPGIYSSVSCVAFSPDGTKALAGFGTKDHVAKLWDASTGELIRTFTDRGQVYSVAFSPDGKMILTGSPEDTIKLWDTSTGEFRDLGGSAYSVAFSPDGSKVLSGSYTTASLCDVSTGTRIRGFFGHSAPIFSVAFSPDGTKVLTGSGDKTAKLWDASTGDWGKCIRTFTGHTGEVFSVAFSPDGTKVLTGSGDKTAKLWDASDGNCIRTVTEHTGGVSSVAFSAQGSEVLTGSGDNTAKLWDISTWTCLYTFTGHTGGATSVAFSSDGMNVLTGSGDGTVRLWRLCLPLVEQARPFIASFGPPSGDSLLNYTQAAEDFEKLPEGADDTPREALEKAIGFCLGALAAERTALVTLLRTTLCDALELYLDGCLLQGNEKMAKTLRIRDREQNNWSLAWEIDQSDRALDDYDRALSEFFSIFTKSVGRSIVEERGPQQAKLADRLCHLCAQRARCAWELLDRQFLRDYRSVGDAAVLDAWRSARSQLLKDARKAMVRMYLHSLVIADLAKDSSDLEGRFSELSPATHMLTELMTRLASGLNPFGYPEDSTPWLYRSDFRPRDDPSYPWPGDNYAQVWYRFNKAVSGAQKQEDKAKSHEEAFDAKRQVLIEALDAQVKSDEFLVQEALRICGGTLSAIRWDGPFGDSSAIGQASATVQTQASMIDALSVRQRNHFTRIDELKNLIKVEAQAAEAKVKIILQSGEEIAASQLGLDPGYPIEVGSVDLGYYCFSFVNKCFFYSLWFFPEQQVQDALSKLQDGSDPPVAVLSQLESFVRSVVVNDVLDASAEEERAAESSLIGAIQSAEIVIIDGWRSQKNLEFQIKNEMLAILETAQDMRVQAQILLQRIGELKGLFEKKEVLRGQLAEAARRRDQINEGKMQDLAYYRLLRDNDEERAAQWFRHAQSVVWILTRALEQEISCPAWEYRDGVYGCRSMDDLVTQCNWIEITRQSMAATQPPMQLEFSLQEDILNIREGYPNPLTGEVIQPDENTSDIFHAWVRKNMADSGGKTLVIDFPLSLRMTNVEDPAHPEAAHTFIPAYSCWDVKIEGVGIRVKGTSLGTGNSAKYKFEISPEGSLMAMTAAANSQGRFEETGIHPFAISRTFLVCEPGSRAGEFRALFWPSSNFAYVYASKGNEDVSYLGQDLKGIHAANTQWRLTLDLNDPENEDCLGPEAKLADIELYLLVTWRAVR